MSTTKNSAASTGGKEVVRALTTHGVRQAFCVPGESYLAVLDALYDVRDDIRLVTCRHEAGAANMAAAYGRLTGRPGVCLATRGPGATQASVGVHTARQESVPMILLLGQVPRLERDREAFQEVDFEQMFAPLAKWAHEIDDPDGIGEVMAEAFARAQSGRPGPVVLSLPEDVLFASCDKQDAAPQSINHPPPDDNLIGKAAELLATAERPLVIVGGHLWSDDGCRLLADFLDASGLPAAVAFRSQDAVDNRKPNYIGDLGFTVNPHLQQRVREADLILALGTRLGDITTSGYSTVEAPRPKQKLIHIYPDEGELNRVFTADVAICCRPEDAVASLAAVVRPRDEWTKWRESARADYEAWLKPQPMPGAVQLGEIVTYMRGRLPRDAVITNGAGNYTGWVHRHYQHSLLHTQLAPKSGAMGFGLPAAIAAKIAQPERDVVAFAGDGCFMMSVNELPTAVAEGANIVVIVIDNGSLATIRMHQEKNYPGRVIGTELKNPDFAALARACGAAGETVLTTDEFQPAFERALTHAAPTVIHVKIDPEAISSQTTLSAIRSAR